MIYEVLAALVVMVIADLLGYGPIAWVFAVPAVILVMLIRSWRSR